MKQNGIHGKRILLVDDDSGVRGSVRMLLEIDDHIVTAASNGAEALDLFTQGQFDLVTTDFEMPVMKGNELAVKIKKLAPKQPIIAPRRRQLVGSLSGACSPRKWPRSSRSTRLMNSTKYPAFVPS